MKHLCILIAIFSLNLFSQDIKNISPRATFKTFMLQMVRYKQKEITEQQLLPTLYQTIESDHLLKNTKDTILKNVAYDLINVFDRLERIDYQDIPENITENKWVYLKQKINFNSEKKYVEISLSKNNNEWKFSKETVDTINLLEETLKDKKIVKDITALSDWRTKFKNHMPDWTGNKTFILYNGQWIGILLLILVGILIDKILSFILSKIIINKITLKNLNFEELKAKKMSFPLGLMTVSITWFLGVQLLEFNESTLSVLIRIAHIAFAISLTWVSGKFVEIVAAYFTQLADQTENKLDDILVPMLTKGAKVFVYCIGLVLIAHSLTIDVTNLLAGLGIGGLAIALAAKDTLSNLFGSITVVLDRPFHIGDWVKIGNDVEGNIAEVGFRSTKIRTFYDSIISIPNSLLTNVHIDNMNKRNFRRYLTHITVQYDTPPEKIEAFCEGIRNLIIAQEYTRKDYFNVYLNNMGSSSLDILLQVYWTVPDYATECAEKHKLLIDIIRLAKKLDIDFAFPTSTVHLYQDQYSDRLKNPLGDKPENFFDWGTKEAENLTNSPIYRKVNRSSLENMNRN